MKTVVKGATLIDGNGNNPLPDSIIIISDGVIEQVGTASDIEVPDKTTVIDASGLTLVPGFIDCHAHLSYHEYNLEKRLITPSSLVAIKTTANLKATLDAGITTVREAGGLDAGIKLAVEQGLVPGPRLYLSLMVMAQTGALWDLNLASGAKLDMTEMLDRTYHYCDGVETFRRKARELLFAGADVLNIATTGSIHRHPGRVPGPMMTPEEIDAVIHEANAAGKHVMAHVDGGPGVQNAIRAGVRSVDHPYYLSDEDIELLLDKDTFLVPTLACNHAIIKIAEHYPDSGIHEEALEGARKIIAIHEEGFSRAARAGVKIAMGTDSFGWFQGDNLLELELMVNGGYTPMQAIQAGTRTAAECLGIGDQTGTIEEGKLADLLAVDCDPLQNIKDLQDKNNIRLIVQQGEIYKNTIAT